MEFFVTMKHTFSMNLYLADSKWWVVYQHHLQQKMRFKDFNQLTENQKLPHLIQLRLGRWYFCTL